MIKYIRKTYNFYKSVDYEDWYANQTLKAQQ